MSTAPARSETVAALAGLAVTRSSGRYWTCLAILATAAVSVRVLPRLLGAYLQKEPVPLKRPLAQFDAGRLGPRYELHPANMRTEPMSEDMLEGLGTREYLQLFLTDTTKPPAERTRVARLFVTYYTGQPDMVPHVPDQCYLAGGYDPRGSTTQKVPVPGVGAPEDEVPVRIVRFRAPPHRGSAPGEPQEVAVLYFFHTNGDYATTRDGVRVRLSNPFQRYAYYAKIEVSFTDQQLAANANSEESLAALGPLLETVMSALLEDHFDLSKFAASAQAQAGR